MYLSCEAMRLDGKKILMYTHYPEWMIEFMDKLDMTRHGRKLGNYEIADMTIKGEVVEREFVTEICRPAQQGQPFLTPTHLLLDDACHSWSGPLGHFHQKRLFDPAITWLGVRSPFLVGCHSAAMSECKLFREFVTETC